MTAAPAVHVSGLDVEPGFAEDFDRWYVEEHLPTALREPGWRRATRYACLDGEPRTLTIFELDDEASGRGPAPAPFRDPAFARRIRDYQARTYREIHAAGADPAAAELINLITVDIDAAGAEAFSSWYTHVHVPEILACPGWLGARRYESTDSDSTFMAVYALADALRPFATPEYESAVGWDEHVERIRGYHGFRIYRALDRVEAP